jgi:hypothetical protein
VLNYLPRYEDVWGSGDISPRILILALDGGKWSDLRPGRFTPGASAHGTRRAGGWVGP